MAKFSQDQLDQAVKEAVAKATEGQTTQADIDAMIAKAVSDAITKAKADAEADKNDALARERSKKEEVAARLREANKKQVPAQLEGLEDAEVETLLSVAAYAKGLSSEKRLSFFENVSTGSYQDMLVQQRDMWKTQNLTPLETENAELKAEIADLKAESIRTRRTEPLREALAAHCNPDQHSQKSGLIAISEMFEPGLDDDGNLIPKTKGELMGIDPETNTPFTPETAAKHLARTVWYLKKPSSTSEPGGDGKQPNSSPSESMSLAEELKGKTPEQKQAIIARRKKAGG